MSKVALKETDWFLSKLLKAGLMFVKKVHKGTGTSGAIYLPKYLVGKTIKIIIIPVDDEEKELLDPKKKDARIKANTDQFEFEMMKKRVRELEEYITSKKNHHEEKEEKKPEPIKDPKRFKIDTLPA